MLLIVTAADSKSNECLATSLVCAGLKAKTMPPNTTVAGHAELEEVEQGLREVLHLLGPVPV